MISENVVIETAHDGMSEAGSDDQATPQTGAGEENGAEADLEAGTEEGTARRAGTGVAADLEAGADGDKVGLLIK